MTLIEAAEFVRYICVNEGYQWKYPERVYMPVKYEKAAMTAAITVLRNQDHFTPEQIEMANWVRRACWFIEIVGNGGRRRISINQKIRNLIKARDKNTCRYCGKHLQPEDMHIDHVMPVLYGGQTEIENLVLACKTCNMRKGNITLESLGWKLREIPNG